MDATQRQGLGFRIQPVKGLGLGTCSVGLRIRDLGFRIGVGRYTTLSSHERLIFKETRLVIIEHVGRRLGLYECRFGLTLVLYMFTHAVEAFPDSTALPVYASAGSGTFMRPRDLVHSVFGGILQIVPPPPPLSNGWI